MKSNYCLLTLVGLLLMVTLVLSTSNEYGLRYERRSDRLAAGMMHWIRNAICKYIVPVLLPLLKRFRLDAFVGLVCPSLE
ncbi:hypothetical protein WA026_003732 [Henosepilachna vigintioctopunctata]|uniref:Uncharacterized protein n=1 Tax=Henosepilachna vigintioctopunctata TaxID=420089 RepID=A0AAW1U8N2_9CUCU